MVETATDGRLWNPIDRPHRLPWAGCCRPQASRPTVGIAVVGLTNNVPVRSRSSSEEVPASRIHLKQ